MVGPDAALLFELLLPSLHWAAQCPLGSGSVPAACYRPRLGEVTLDRRLERPDPALPEDTVGWEAVVASTTHWWRLDRGGRQLVGAAGGRSCANVARVVQGENPSLAPHLLAKTMLVASVSSLEALPLRYPSYSYRSMLTPGVTGDTV